YPFLIELELVLLRDPAVESGLLRDGLRSGRDPYEEVELASRLELRFGRGLGIAKLLDAEELVELLVFGPVQGERIAGFAGTQAAGKPAQAVGREPHAEA